MQLKTSIYCQTIHTIYPYMSEPIQNYLNPFRTTGTGTWFRHMFKIKELCGKFSSRHLFPAEKKLCYEKKIFYLFIPSKSALIKIQSGSGPNIWWSALIFFLTLLKHLLEAASTGLFAPAAHDHSVHELAGFQLKKHNSLWSTVNYGLLSVLRSQSAGHFLSDS